MGSTGNGSPKAIIFDLGRVLVDVEFTSGFMKHFDTKGTTPDEVISTMLENKIFKAFNAGTISPEAFAQEFCAQYGLDYDFEQFREQWCDVFSPMPGMPELVASLKERYPLGLLSDTDPMHWGYLREHYPVAGLFDKPVLSFETGYPKPDARAFLAAAESVSQPPQACVYIDDLARNVAGAIAVGMDAIQFADAAQIRRELTARGVVC